MSAERFIVSGFRKVIVDYGKPLRRFAYGEQPYTPRVTADGIRVAPHREFYTDADAQTVVEMLNQRVAAIKVMT